MTNPHSLDDIVTLYHAVGGALGYEQPDIQLYRPTGREVPEDVPGNGELAAPAEHLYDALETVLIDWNYYIDNPDT